MLRAVMITIRRVLEILTYLQARLRADIGGEPAVALSEFYAGSYMPNVCVLHAMPPFPARAVHTGRPERSQRVAAGRSHSSPGRPRSENARGEDLYLAGFEVDRILRTYGGHAFLILNGTGITPLVGVEGFIPLYADVHCRSRDCPGFRPEYP